MKGANNKIVLALVGAGGRGSVIIDGMMRCDSNIEVKYICDVDASRGGKLLEDLTKIQGYAPKKVSDMRTAYDDKDVNAAVIATPDHWHALATIWACRAGKDVLVEKPVCLTLDEGREMVKAAADNKVVVQCGTQNRSGEFAFTARDYIAAGELGKIVTVKVFGMQQGTRQWVLKEDEPVPDGLDWDAWLGPAESVPYNVSRHKGWHDWWAYSTGSHMFDTSHGIDLARMVLGDPLLPHHVYCAGGRVIFNDNRDIPDNQTAVFDMEDYPISFESSQYGRYLYGTPDDVRYSDKYPQWNTMGTRIEIYGIKGMMYLGRMGGGWQVFGEDMKLLAEGQGRFPDEPHQRNFLECVRTRKTPNATIEQGVMSVTLINLANLAYRSGKKMLGFDPVTGTITGNAEAAALDKRPQRKGYELI